MRELPAEEVVELVSRLYLDANFNLPEDVIASLEAALAREQSPLGREVLEILLANAETASREHLPLCQDTGMAVFFAEMGSGLTLTGATLEEVVNLGVADARRRGPLRASVVADPCFERKNTKDNTPAVLHTDLVPGDGLRLTVLPKGGGSENMGRLAMLKPSDGLEGLIEFAVETVELGGANACPPIFLGVGVGGTMDRAATLAKRALLRPAGKGSCDQRLADLEARILDRVNGLGIGPAGLGGSETCLGVAIEDYPCHIASLPVAVNIQCNSARRASGTL